MFTNPGRKMMMLAATAAATVGMAATIAPPAIGRRQPPAPTQERRYRYRGGKQWTPGNSWRQLKRAVAHGHEPMQPTDAMKAKHSWYHRPLAAKS